MYSPSQILPVVATAGELLLRSGAEVGRVEDTVERIARAYGIPEAEIYATPTGLIITLGADHTRTAVRRVKHRTFALDKVSAVNALSREMAVAPIEPAEALRRLKEIATDPAPIQVWAAPFTSALAAASCTMLVGGHLSDFGPALLANAVVQGVQRLLSGLQLPEAIGDFLSGSAAVFCAMAATAWLGADFTAVIAGGIMILLPGIAFTTAVRDAMMGDLTSAGARSLEAMMQAAALASGVAATLYVTGRL